MSKTYLSTFLVKQDFKIPIMSLGGVTNASTSKWLTLDKVFWNQKAELMDACISISCNVIIIYFIVHIILLLINYPELSWFTLTWPIAGYPKLHHRLSWPIAVYPDLYNLLSRTITVLGHLVYNSRLVLHLVLIYKSV